MKIRIIRERIGLSQVSVPHELEEPTMKTTSNRHDFPKADGSDPLLSSTTASRRPASVETKKNFKTVLFKSFIADSPTPEVCKAHAEAGFQGLEVKSWDASEDQIRKGKQVADDFGLRVHSVMRGWSTNLNSEEEGVRRQSLETIRKSIQTAALYGAETVLLVPCVVGWFERRQGDPLVPNPNEFRIEFDPATCQVLKAVEGDNSPYADYIRLQNRATELTFQSLQEVTAAAAYEGVRIGIENVWNNLWVTPELFSAFIALFDSPWVKAYFDLGNHAKYADAEDYLRAIGKRDLCKLHLKEFRVDPTKVNTSLEGFVPFGTGTIDWPSVRETLDEIGYSGWVSYEEEAYSPAEYGRRLDQFFRGERIGGSA